MESTLLAIILLITVITFYAVVFYLKAFSKKEAVKERVEQIKSENQIRKMSRKEKKKAAEAQKRLDKAKRLEMSSKLSSFDKKDVSKRKISKSDSEIKKMLAILQIDISKTTFTLIRIVVGIGFAIIAYFTGLILVSMPQNNAYLLMVVGMVLGMMMPKMYLQRKVKARKLKIKETMPDMIELLSLSVDAGLGYDAAVMTIWQKNKSEAMQEMVRTIDDVRHGVSRKDAYKALAARCDLKEMTMLANNLSQADKLGVSISDVLKSEVQSLRKMKELEVEALIQKAPIKMTIPTVLFIFPSLFVVLLGPAAYNIMDVM